MKFWARLYESRAHAVPEGLRRGQLLYRKGLWIFPEQDIQAPREGYSSRV